MLFGGGSLIGTPFFCALFKVALSNSIYPYCRLELKNKLSYIVLHYSQTRCTFVKQ